MNRRLAVLMTLLLCVLCACTDGGGAQAPDTSPAAGSSAYQAITPEQAMLMMEGSEHAILLDVRTDEEYREQHIGGALLLPDYDIASRADALLPDRDAPILVYCRTGHRSAAAARELLGMGYTNVYDLGGILDWPYETVSD